MINILKNPISYEYLQLKKFLLSADFPWYYNSKATPEDVDTGEYQDVPFYGHVLMSRPRWNTMGEKLYPEVRSLLMENIYPILEQIIDYNNLEVNCLLRFNANCVHPSKDSRLSIPHNDHQFSHKNILIYFTDSGGETVVFDDEMAKYEFHPKSEDIITFSGLHCMRPPKENRRIVLVATYL